MILGIFAFACENSKKGGLLFYIVWCLGVTFISEISEKFRPPPSLMNGHLLKFSIFVEQKAAAPKNGVDFCWGSIGIIRSSLATSYDV